MHLYILCDIIGNNRCNLGYILSKFLGIYPCPVRLIISFALQYTAKLYAVSTPNENRVT